MVRETANTQSSDEDSGLRIISARYGPLGSPMPFRDHSIDVAERLRSMVKGGSVDIVVNNSTLTPNENPFRGKKKVLLLTYSIDGGEEITIERVEKDWLIIGPVGPALIDEGKQLLDYGRGKVAEMIAKRDGRDDDVRPVDTLSHLTNYSGNRAVDAVIELNLPRTPAALNDYLVRKFQISDRRLRGPMPIELRDFHRNDLAQLFAELGFKRGAEIGVAEGHYSEILLKANPDLELLLVDPWRRYDGNPYAHSQEHQDFSLNETKRKTAPYPNVKIMQDFSMNAVREVEENSLDFAYIDAHHGFDWVMEDLITWGRRVRSGGIISGDDYYHFKRHWAGVVEAVNAYTLGHRISLWFLIDAPRSVDFFFVKP